MYEMEANTSSADVTASPPWMWARPTPSLTRTIATIVIQKNKTQAKMWVSLCVFTVKSVRVSFTAQVKYNCLLYGDGYSQFAAKIGQTVNKPVLHVNSVPTAEENIYHILCKSCNNTHLVSAMPSTTKRQMTGIAPQYINISEMCGMKL